MARIHNDNLPSVNEGHRHQGQGQQQAGNTYDVNNFPRMFGELIGRRIGTTYDDSNFFGCLVKHARPDEFQVEVLVQRNHTDLNYNPDIRLRTSGTIVLTMKYEGRIDGIDQFSLKGIDSRTCTVGLNRFGEIIRQSEQCPQYDIGIFGVAEETLRNDYGTLFRIADAETVDGRAGAPQQQQERAASDYRALPCGCR